MAGAAAGGASIGGASTGGASTGCVTGCTMPARPVRGLSDDSIFREGAGGNRGTASRNRIQQLRRDLPISCFMAKGQAYVHEGSVITRIESSSP